MTSCTTLGFPHIGTVDTRPQKPGTYHAQFSLGGGAAGLIVPSIAGGANLAADIYVTEKLSLNPSGHALISIGPDGEFLPGARLGVRYRPNPKLSLGGGASIDTGMLFEGNDPPSPAYGVDLEVATSNIKSKNRFDSHAWRLHMGLDPVKRISISVLGDWSRSIPTNKDNVRFSYGVNYGASFSTDETSLVTLPPAEPNGPPNPQPDTGTGMSLIIGGHLGIQFGSPRGLR